MSTNRGLTLIEVLVALVIIAVAFMALAAAQINNIRVTRDSKQASVAMQVANEGMERAVKAFLEDEADPDVPAFDCGIGGIPCSGDFADITIDGAAYVAHYEIVVGAVSPGLTRIDVTVDDPKPVTLTQLVSCMDVVPPPSFSDPSPCPEPVSP